MKVRSYFIRLSIIVPVLLIALSFLKPGVLWLFVIVLPLIVLGYLDINQKKQSIKRNFPVVGNLRYLLEKFRPEIMQYFVETDTEGRPINRNNRSLIYQRAKNVTDSTPFGTQLDVYQPGYEWMAHSIYAKNANEIKGLDRVLVGGKDCKTPYSASVLNVSAMSFGSLSENAVLALNKGAKIGGFAQNTGEGGISPYHLENDGDLIWQIGTGYFGCRSKEGGFSAENFVENALNPSVKMIELKLSQGAKPGHGGILPAKKNTLEIAKIRNVEPFKDVLSPPFHTAFKDGHGMMRFIKQLRDLSGGKPIGFKLCIGKKDEFIDICQAMIDTGIKPDFITIDGGEGGTGAAPVEFSNSLGLPLYDGLTFAYNTLVGFDIKDDIKLIASGKIITGFDMIRALSLGADICSSARAMMLAIGCIQALECNKNTCPVGVATQDKGLMKGLDVEDKAQRTANYQTKTVHSFLDLLAASGISKREDITRELIFKRVSSSLTKTYEEIYPSVLKGSLIKKEVV